MGRIGKSYSSRISASDDALARFDRELTEPQAREFRNDLTAAIVLVLLVLGVIGWAFTL
ncbi:MAG TPA: hypothetical protein VF211_14170 [Burkholderiales bacterium]